MKKLISIIVALALCLSMAVPTFAVDKVPVSGGKVVAVSRQLLAPTSTTNYNETIAEAGTVLRKAMTSRTGKVAIKYHIKSNTLPSIQKMAQSIFDNAVKHTGKSNEGDALAWGWVSWQCSISYYQKGSDYYIDFNYDLEYYINARQEAELKEELSALMGLLDIDDKTNYEKVKAIYTYMTSNISYDYEHLEDDSYLLKQTDYAALIHGTSVCQGYAMLFYRLCLEYGIDCRIISGVAGGGLHAWNIVKLGNQYYNIDSTWDAGYDTTEYFLVGKTYFEKTHTPDADYLKSSFTSKYPISDTAYSGSDVEVDKAYLKTKTYTYSGAVKKPAVVVTNTKGKTLIQGEDYSLTYSAGRKLAGKYYVKVKFLGEYEGTPTKTLYFTIKAKTPSVKSLTPGAGKLTVKTYANPSTKGGAYYQIAYKVKGTSTWKYTTTTTYYKTIKSLKKGKQYTVKMRTGRTQNGVKYYSSWSAVKTSNKIK